MTTTTTTSTTATAATVSARIPTNNPTIGGTTTTNNNDDDDSMQINVGRLVEVASRTWPGINKPGGVARVTEVTNNNTNNNNNNNNNNNDDSNICFVSVQYIVGSSKERNVPIEYVTLAPQYETTTAAPTRSKSLRDRNMLLGRCRRCGSLRTDCGSCDWAVEEEEEEEEQQQQQQAAGTTTTTTTKATNTTPTAKKSSLLQTKRRKSSNKHELDDSSDSSTDDDDDDDDEDVLLQQLLKQSKSRHRKHLRQRARWKRMGLGVPTADRTVKSARKNTVKDHEDNDDDVNNEPSFSDDDDDDDSDDDIEELMERNKRRHEEYLRMRNKPMSRRLLSPPMSKSKKSSSRPFSVLETATMDANDAKSSKKKRQTTTTTTITKQQQSNRRQQKHKSNPQPQRHKNNFTETQNINNTIDISTTTTHPLSSGSVNNNNNESEEVLPPPEIGSVGCAESSSPESMAQHYDDDNDDFSQHHGDMPSQPRFDSDGSDNDDDDDVSMNDDSFYFLDEQDADNYPPGPLDSSELALSQFIQPEGQEVAENLPQDMVDLTKDVAYWDLPHFFDSMATRLEDELLPNFKLRSAELQRELRVLTSSSSSLSNNDNNNDTIDGESNNASNLLQKCRLCWSELRRRLIRNGTDQCGAALRRLSSDRLYKQAKKQMSTSQRKLCRRGLDVRGLRMDALENATEALVRKLRDIVDACEEEAERQQRRQRRQANSDDDDDGDDNGDSSEDQYETQDLVPLNSSIGEGAAADTNRLDPCERPLAPFDPHMYASRKKKKRNKITTATMKRQRSISSTSTTTTTKRQKTSRSSSLSTSLDSIDFESRRNHRFRRHGTSKRRPLSISSLKRKHSTSGRPTSSSSSSRKARGSRRPQIENPEAWNEQVTNDMHAEFETDDNDPSEVVNLDGEAPTFNLFDDDGGGDNSNGQGTSTSKRGGPRGTRPSGTRLAFTMPVDHVAENGNFTTRSNPRDRQQPIAQRMQAFLDANSGNADETWAADSTTTTTTTTTTRGTTSRGRTNAAVPSRSSVGRHASDGSGSLADSRGRHADPSNHQRQGEGRAPDQAGDQGGNILHESQNNEGQSEVPAAPTNVDGLFLQLRTTQPPSLTPIVSLVGTANSWSIDEVAIELRQSYTAPSRAGSAFLDALRAALESGTLEGTAVLPKLFEVLRTHGKYTLQEMISLNSPVITAHVRVLAQCVLLLHAQPSGQVFNESHGLLLETLVSKPRPFYDWLVLQCVEVVYAAFIPTAWALQSVPPNTLQIIAPLRDALAKAVPLVESVCVCTLSLLGCQQWRRGVTEGHAFVSSIDPQAWKSFWDSGNGPQKPTAVRLDKVGKVIPRVEADALWGMLAYFGGCASSPAQTSAMRWQLVSKIFSGGVLAAGETHDISSKGWLPPSPAQLAASAKEVGYFAILLSQGCFDSIPSSDGVVTKLIRWSLELQGDEYYGNEHARAAAYPLFSNEKAAKKVSSRLWKATHPLFFKDGDSVEYQSCTSFALPIDVEAPELDRPRLKNMLVPTSDILKQCLTLLCTWIPRVPAKKARQNRLLKSVQTLQRELVDQAKEAEKLTVALDERANQDAFASAFQVGSRPSSIAGKAAERREIFFREAAAYVTLLDVLARYESNSPNTILSYDMTLQVWQTVANSEMKSRQIALVNGTEVSGKFQGDPVRLFVAAKLMACTTFVHMNISPWSLTVGNTATRLSSHETRAAADKSSVRFSLSCIFACLDCLCELPNHSEVMSRLYSIISLAFTNMTGLVVKGESLPGEQDIRDVATSACIPVLEKCFKVHIRSFGETKDSLSLRLLYCAIRGVNSFLATCTAERDSHSSGTELLGSQEARESQNADRGKGGEDIWGSLDDDIFAAMDLPGSSLSNQVQSETSQRSLWSCFTGALGRSKPSERFAINSTLLAEGSTEISIHGTHLISQDVDRVCDCLISILLSSSKDHDAQQFLKDIASYIWRGQDDSNDGQFECQIAQRLAEEICALSEKFSICREFVQTHSECFLLNYIGRILDAKRMENLPSRNLKRIREANGEENAAHALAMLELFNDDYSQEIRNDADFGAMARLRLKTRTKLSVVWQFGQNLGSTFKMISMESSASASTAALGDVLINDFNESSSSLYPVSLESEGMKCLRLLIGVVSAIPNQSSSRDSNFEKVTLFAIGTVIKHILRIVQSMKYYDQTCNLGGAVTESDITRTRISELLQTYTEVFIALLSWVARESASHGSENWKAFWRKTLDSVIFPILKGRQCDLIVPLQQMQAISQSTMEGRNRTATLATTLLSGCSKYLNNPFTSVIRRSRQWFVAQFRKTSIQSFLHEAVRTSSDADEERISKIVGRSFSTEFSPSTVTPTYDSPLQQEIDEYLWSVENAMSTRPDNINKLREARLGFVNMFICPVLCQKQEDIAKRRKALRVLDSIFMSAAHEKVMNFSSTDVEALCFCVKSICSSLVQCLAKPVVDTDLISVVHACSTNLANVCIVESNAETHYTLLNWSRAVMEHQIDKNVDEVSRKALAASYLWTFFRWLQKLGYFMIATDVRETKKIELFREKCKTALRDDVADVLTCSIRSLLYDGRHFESWDRLLSQFEERLFPSTARLGTNIVNKYEKKTENPESINKPWTSTASVKRAAKEFIAEVVAVS